MCDEVLDQYNTSIKHLEKERCYLTKFDYLYYKNELLDTLNSIGRVKESVIIKAMKQIINVLEFEKNEIYYNKTPKKWGSHIKT